MSKESISFDSVLFILVSLLVMVIPSLSIACTLIFNLLHTSQSRS